jgi:hypothetical protein
MLEDWMIWLCVRLTYECLGGDVAEVECDLWGERFHLVVCTSCTAVFRPALDRRRDVIFAAIDRLLPRSDHRRLYER